MNAAVNATRQILVINPNGNAQVTARVQQCADRVLSAGCTALAVHSEGSPHSIETLADRLLAEPLAIKLLSQRRGFDAYVMACFDDIAVKEARQFLTAPVVDCVEASVTMARLYTGRFAIVTTVESMVPGIRSLIETLGAADQCTVRAAGIGVASAASSDTGASARLDDTIEIARTVDRAGAIILGSGGLTGRGPELSRRHGLPVIDCIEAAVLLADAASRGRVQASPPQHAAESLASLIGR